MSYNLFMVTLKLTKRQLARKSVRIVIDQLLAAGVQLTIVKKK